MCYFESTLFLMGMQWMRIDTIKETSYNVNMSLPESPVRINLVVEQ